MARGPATFKQQDVTRALRGAKDAGFDAQRVEIKGWHHCLRITQAMHARSLVIRSV
jgi:hypothetical protein